MMMINDDNLINFNIITKSFGNDRRHSLKSSFVIMRIVEKSLLWAEYS